MINLSRFRFSSTEPLAAPPMGMDFEQALTWPIENVSQKINKAFRQPLYIDAKEVVGYEHGESPDNDGHDDLFHEVLLELEL